MSRVIAGSGAGTGLAVALSATLLLAGCGAPTPQSRASAAQQAACRQRADEVYTQRNRDAKYIADAYVSGTRDTPFSASGATGDTSSGLAGQYSRDTIYSDCINGIGAPLGAAPEAPAPPQPAP
jgi:hypothetical protein